MIAAGATMVPPPDTVTTAVAHPEKWQEELPAIGSIGAVQGVTVTTEIGGTVKEIAFESGKVVAAGDLLVRLDTSSEEAQLRALESQVELAAINLERSLKLRTNNTIAQSELDTAQFALKQDQANADNIHAIIAKKTIRAPFAGRLGIRQVNLGAIFGQRQAGGVAPVVDAGLCQLFAAAAGTGPVEDRADRAGDHRRLSGPGLYRHTDGH